jgi:hypothetical protein
VDLEALFAAAEQRWLANRIDQRADGYFLSAGCIFAPEPSQRTLLWKRARSRPSPFPTAAPPE